MRRERMHVPSRRLDLLVRAARIRPAAFLFDRTRAPRDEKDDGDGE